LECIHEDILARYEEMRIRSESLRAILRKVPSAAFRAIKRRLSRGKR